jgi:hypothetical protein
MMVHSEDGHRVTLWLRFSGWEFVLGNTTVAALMPGGILFMGGYA